MEQGVSKKKSAKDESLLVDQTVDEPRKEQSEGVQAAEEEFTTESVVDIPIVEDVQDATLPGHRELNLEEMEHYRGLMEAVLFVSTEPLTLNMIARRCELDRVNARIIVDSIVDDYAERDGGILLKEIAGGYQFVTSERYSQILKGLYKETKREKLSRSALEALAIVAYKQPITLPEIDEIRGASSRPMIATLLSKKLIKPQGYKPVPGRPTLYVSTKTFLSRFGLNSLADLPTLEDIKELKFDEID